MNTITALLATAAFTLTVSAEPDANWLNHDRTRPLPPVVDPGTASTPAQPGRPPSDAIVLFDGKDISPWVAMDGSPTKWIVRDGYMESVKGAGYIRTRQNFGDCQLHVEWASPNPPSGSGQGRGNSGVFLGRDRYEIQVLDSHGNKTYADGSAGSIYGQYPPLVNVTRPPGEWQTYDILYTAPRFDAAGKLTAPARITAFHNGVLIQHNSEPTGPTSWLERAPYSAHPEKQPIAFQDHGNPVRYRNIWLRELGQPGKPEISPPIATLDRYAGKYERVEFVRQGDSLLATFNGVKFPLFAETETKFFAKTTDVQFEFKPGADGKTDEVLVSVGEGGSSSKRLK